MCEVELKASYHFLAIPLVTSQTVAYSRRWIKVAQNIFENGGWVQVRAVGRQRGQTRAPLSARHQLFFLALGTTWILVFSTGRATTPCRYTSYLDYRTGYSAFGCFFFTKPDLDMFPSLAATNLVAPTFSFKVKFVASDRPIYPGTVSQG